MKTYLILVTLFLTIFISCSKNTLNITPSGFKGTWTLYQIYGNDYWGGRAYWKNVDPGTKIKFTADHKYYRRDFSDSAYILIGTYTQLQNGNIQITQNNPPNPSYPTYILDYVFEPKGFMTWGNFGTEGLIKEKFKL